MITQKILDTFVYETMAGTYQVTDPTEFDQVVPGGPWQRRAEAEEALTKYIDENQITFE